MKALKPYLISLFCFVCVIAPFTSSGQVTAGFTADRTTGCAPLIVNFTNTSTGATSYSWVLGNTNTSFFTNAVTTYLSPGTYTVTLTATGTSGSNTYSMQITVYPPPTISFSATDTSVCLGTPVSFTNATSLGVPGSGTYNWNFGDGSNSTAQAPTHNYGTPGYYSVTLTATNNDSCSASTVLNSYIHVLPSPVVQFTASSNSFCGLPASVIFTDQSTGNGTLTHTWLFGDNPTSPSASPTHNYTTTGVFTVSEIVVDSHGCRDTLTDTNYVSVQNVVATMNAPDTACANQTVLFQNTTTGTGVTSFWFFGDGYTDQNTNSSHVYSSDGTYTVKLVSYINGCNDTVSKSLYIRPAPTISFSHTPAHPCPAPVNIQFTGNAPTGSTYAWIFGDGSPTSTLAAPTHTYTSDSFFLVSMVATTNGCTYIVSDTVRIYNLLLAVDSPSFMGCAPMTAFFNAHAITTTLDLAPPIPYPYSTIAYSIDYGDGSPVSTQTMTHHTYNNPGFYSPIYSVTTANGCTINDTGFNIAAPTPTLDSFIVSPVHVCKHDPVTFRAHGNGIQPLTYVYEPGQGLGTVDGINDSVQNFVYPDPGIFYADAYVSTYNCQSQKSAQVQIIVDSPRSFFPPPGHFCDSPLKVYLESSSVGATSLQWLLGDGTYSTVTALTHSYPAFGPYQVSLATFNSNSGCRDTMTQYINLLDFEPQISVADTVVCKYGYLHFTELYNAPNPPPILHKWFVNNIFIDSSQQLTYQFVYPGIYTVTLYDSTSSGCGYYVHKQITVGQPVVNLTASPRQVCFPGSVLFTDSSVYVTGTYAANHVWDFGDGSPILSTPNSTISHQYTSAGSFNVKEIVTDDIGCRDSIVRGSYVVTHKPVANFAVANPNRCAGDTITFVNTGTSAGLRSTYWSFGDGTSSTAASPTHSYNASGSYNITLAVIDTAGCTDTLSRSAYINISKPHAAFSETPASGVCVPLIVQFTNTSVSGATYTWSFGNVNTSLATNPTNSYATPGIYPIQLIVADAHGCKDTASSHVTLYGYTGSFSYTPLYGCPPLTVNFTSAITDIPSITWDFADGSIAGPSTATTAAHSYSAPGKYVPKIILVDSAGCHSSSYGTDTIKVDKVHAGFKATSPICIYDTVHFTDTSSGLFSSVTNWYWTLGDASTSFSHNPFHNYRTSGNFSVTLVATDAAGCKDTVVNTILIHPLPVISAIGDTAICPGDSAKVSASGGVSYVWGPASSISCPSCNPTFVAPVAPTTYVVIGADAFGCKNKDSVKIGSTYKTVSHAGPGGQICLGQSITLSDSGAQSYSWYPATGLSDSHSEYPVASPGYSITYLAIAKTASCLPDTNYVNVVVNPLPKVTAVGGSTVLAGNKTNLQAYGPDILYFMWDHPELLSCDSCTNPLATMQQSTWFTVTATNQYGCQDTAGVLINVLCDKSQVFIPNTFTPNGDGQNDVFYPRGIGIRVVRSFRIYNRWGELVFQRNNIKLNDEGNGWDGTFNGAKPVPDTYVYAVDAICDDGEPIDWKGDVTLIR